MIPPEEIHVWIATLDPPPAAFDSLWRILSADEKDRAARFRLPEDQRRFVAAHGVLRDILGRYLEAEPPSLEFCRGPNGKPALSGAWRNSQLRFNLSHSHGVVVYAVANGREVGVDVEFLNPRTADEDIAERFFTPGEVAALRSLPESLWVEGFYNCWTRKEAFVKATGEGLSARLDRFEVTLAPGEPAAFLQIDGEPPDRSRWSLQALMPAPGYAAAVVAEGAGWSLRVRNWQGWASPPSGIEAG